MGYSKGKASNGENRGGTGGTGHGPKYSAGKNSAHARGISTGRSGSTKVDVNYGQGQSSKGENWKPDGKNRSTPFKQGGRS